MTWHYWIGHVGLATGVILVARIVLVQPLLRQLCLHTDLLLAVEERIDAIEDVLRERREHEADA